MHPVLERRSNLLLYLIAWLPPIALLALLLRYTGKFRWPEALLIAAPMAALLAFLSLSAWYLCKAFPLRDASYLRLLGIHTAAAVFSSAVWVLLGDAFVSALARIPGLAGVDDRYSSQVPLLLVIGALIFLISVSVHYLVLAFERSREAEERSLKLQILARESELKALRAQISPHFLFNSLNSISALTSIDPARARKMSQLLADFLRKSLELGAEEFITLDDEIALARDFLAIEQIRFGPRLDVGLEATEESRRCLVPSLILQPLIENAVKHGISQVVSGGRISVHCAVRGSRLKIIVENPRDTAAPEPRTSGFGLENIRSRLSNLYDREAGIETRKSDESFRAEVTLPARRVTRQAAAPSATGVSPAVTGG
jgi:two-component system sensor histidine kinase AlgZ